MKKYLILSLAGIVLSFGQSHATALKNLRKIIPTTSQRFFSASTKKTAPAPFFTLQKRNLYTPISRSFQTSQEANQAKGIFINILGGKYDDSTDEQLEKIHETLATYDNFNYEERIGISTITQALLDQSFYEERMEALIYFAYLKTTFKKELISTLYKFSHQQKSVVLKDKDASKTKRLHGIEGVLTGVLTMHVALESSDLL